VQYSSLTSLAITYFLIYDMKRYEKESLDIALSLYEIAGPIFVSLKEEVNPARYKVRSHSDVKEPTFTQLRILLAIEYGKGGND
jgi:hypothetical protein